MRFMQTAAAITMLTGLATLASAQAGGTTGKDTMMKSDGMGMGTVKNYTGCVEAGSAAGTFVLTHLSPDMAMGKDTMTKDTMKKDAMMKDSMKDTMMPQRLALTGTAVNVAPHLGHKVTVSGKVSGQTDFMVSTVKMVAASCQ